MDRTDQPQGVAPLRIDLHTKILDEAVVERAVARGLDGLVYAPHFSRLPEIEERARRFARDDLFVIPGREVFTGSWRDRKHVLALGLDAPVPDFITLDGAMAEFDRQGATVLVPHPTFATVSLSAGDIRRYTDRIHAVETYNPKHLPWHNRRARAVRDAVGLPAFASSYAHLRGTIGEAWTAFPDTDPEPAAVLETLRRGGPRSVGRRAGVGHRLRCTVEASHLLYENTASKANRVILSGMEATHPRHPAYEGRFDEVAVY